MWGQNTYFPTYGNNLPSKQLTIHGNSQKTTREYDPLKEANYLT